MSPRILSQSVSRNRSRVAYKQPRKKLEHRPRVNIHAMGTTIIIDKVVVPRTCSGCAHHNAAPKIGKPARLRWRDATTWRLKARVISNYVFDALSVVGSVILFILSRVGIGLRGEDVAALLNRGSSP